MAFHPYPRVIPPVFNPGGFGPPRGLTPASACPRIAHPASRPRRATVKRWFNNSLSLRLACWLRLAAQRDSLAHSTKGTPSPCPCGPSGLRLLGGARFQVLFHSPPGVLFTFPSRYWFAIGHRNRVQPWRVVPPASDRVSRARPYSGRERSRGAALRLRGCHPVPPACPGRSAAPSLSDRAGGCGAPRALAPTTPAPQRPRAVTQAPVWAGPVSLAATPGISVDFSSSGYLDVSVPRVASAPHMCSAARARALARAGSPIRRSAGQRLFAPHRGLSQLATSFVAVLCQGIHRAPMISSQLPCREQRDTTDNLMSYPMFYIGLNQAEHTCRDFRPSSIALGISDSSKGVVLFVRSRYKNH